VKLITECIRVLELPATEYTGPASPPSIINRSARFVVISVVKSELTDIDITENPLGQEKVKSVGVTSGSISP